MKLNIRSIIVLIVGIVSVYIIFITNNIEHYRIEEDFKVDLKKLKVKEKFRKEEWTPNGDGFKMIVLNYEKLDGGIIDLEKLPIKENLPPNEIPKEFTNISEGYYKFIKDEEDDRSFKVMIINSIKKEICIYYQIM